MHSYNCIAAQLFLPVELVVVTCTCSCKLLWFSSKRVLVRVSPTTSPTNPTSCATVIAVLSVRAILLYLKLRLDVAEKRAVACTLTADKPPIAD